MKKIALFFLSGSLAVLLAGPAAAQAAPPTAGRLSYEFSQLLDPSKVKMMGVGAQGQTADLSSGGIELRGPNGQTIELPRSMSRRQEVFFSGSLARESGGAGSGMTVMRIGGGGSSSTERAAPYAEQRFLNLAARTTTTTLTVEGTTYAQAPQPVPAPPADWRELTATKKVAGYQCHKVTATYQQHPYTLWVTTELPFTYSPVPALTPARGVVLALSSDEQQYTATQFVAEPVDPATLRPAPGAKPVTVAELTELREQARATAKRRMIEQLTSGHQ